MNATNVGARVSPTLARARDDALEVGARVSLLEELEDTIVDRLDGGRDERTAGVAQAWQRVGMFEQVLDLDRDVVRQARKLGGEPFDDRHGVPDAVEEVRVAKRDVLVRPPPPARERRP